MADQDVKAPTLWNGKFKAGAEVRLVKPYTHGESANQREENPAGYPTVGDIGKVQPDSTQVSRKSNGWLAVEWTKKETETKLSGKWTDVECFVLVDEPTDEEMKEVIESLGGNHEPIGDLEDAITLLKMHEQGSLTSDQTVEALKLDLGVKPRTDVSLVLGTAVTMASRGEIETDTLVHLVETFARI